MHILKNVYLLLLVMHYPLLLYAITQDLVEFDWNQLG